MSTCAPDRWRGFLVWLDSGVSGIRPCALQHILGPIVALLPLARQVAREIDPWLLNLLAERQRLALACIPRALADIADIVERDTSQQPYRRGETSPGSRWLGWLLTAELLRLTRLAEAPEIALQRRDWLTWEVRYWALAVCLVRVGQLYADLERRQGRKIASRALEASLTLAWNRATAAARAA